MLALDSKTFAQEEVRQLGTVLSDFQMAMVPAF